MSIAVGDRVEDFELVGSDGGRYKLETALQKGPVGLEIVAL